MEGGLVFRESDFLAAVSEDDTTFMIDQCFATKARETLMTIAMLFDGENPRPDALAITRRQDGRIELVHGYNPSLSQAIAKARREIGAAIDSRRNGGMFVWTFKGPHAEKACLDAVQKHAVHIVRAEGSKILLADGEAPLMPKTPAHALLDEPLTVDLGELRIRLAAAALDRHCRKLRNWSAKLDSVAIALVDDDGTIYGTRETPIDDMGAKLQTRHATIGFAITGEPGRHWPALALVDVMASPPAIRFEDIFAKGIADIADAILIHKEPIRFEMVDAFS